jgi:hypothetical protein
MINRYIRRVLHPAVRYTVQRISFVLVFAAILFLAAGKLSWFRGWVYLLYGLVLSEGYKLTRIGAAPVMVGRAVAHLIANARMRY